jgi:hypothetical protein
VVQVEEVGMVVEVLHLDLLVHSLLSTIMQAVVLVLHM